MKGFVKVIIAGAVILCIGVAVLVITLALNGWQVDGDYEMKSYECEQTHTSLDLNFSAGSLDVCYYDGEKIKVEYPENKDLTAEITENDGTFAFATKNAHKWFNLSFFRKIPATKIWIPQSSAVNLTLKIDAGAVQIAEGTYGEVIFDMDAGALVTGNLICKKLALDIDAGAVDLSSVVSEQNVVCNMSAGALEIGSLKCPSLAIDVSAGAVKVKELETDVIEANISAGSVELSAAGGEQEYSVSVDKSAGSCNLINRTGTTEKRITAHISAGSLEVKFKN